ncbi:ring finger domain containing protein [Nitzschia inconspicua]|uniref:Ring finger domain containing protein n=1 Tax=Nitzschia inconspicua TaxID=303405 RepID=A0A9K3K9Y0_9STRA|nr:ring finger domain containing protein [Nitzschia inconspicua]KAG7362434.1 ring finger domain containing protein [Nitzschia inconspicua]
MIQILRLNLSRETHHTNETQFFSSSNDSASSSTSRGHDGNRRSRRSRRETNSCNKLATTAPTFHLLHMRLRGLDDTENMVEENAKFYDDCVICAESFATDDVVCRLPCGHIHHSHCILSWLHRNHDTCPTCRQSVTKKNAFSDGSPNFENVEEGDYDVMLIRQQHKAVLQKCQNFDLIMRRVLRAQEEQHHQHRPVTAAAVCFDNNNDSFDETITAPLNDDTPPPPNHTRQSSCSNDWLADDLEDFLNV